MEIKLKPFTEWRKENDAEFKPFELDEPSTEDGKTTFSEFTIEDWTEIPGIGKTLAKRIVESGPYEQVDDLSNVRGISQRVLENIKSYLAP